MKAGVALFDAPARPAEGWASLGGEPAKAFAQPRELPSDVFWITNCDFGEFRESGLGAAGNFADDQYLRTRTGALLAELGLPPRGREAAQAAGVAAARCLSLAERVCPVSGGYRLAHALRGALVTGPMRRRPPPPVADGLANAHQINQGMKGRPLAGAATRTFMLPRAALAHWLLTRPVPAPGAEWSASAKHPRRPFGHVDGRALAGTKAAVGWLADLAGSGRTALLRISLTRTSPDFAPFATFGAGAGVLREWAALPEVLHVARFAEVRILEAHLADAARCPLPDAVARLLKAPWVDTGTGLFLENVLAAFALRGSDRSAGAAAVWQRAYDRALTSRYAEALAQHSICVGSHAHGRLVAFVPPGEEAVCDGVARDYGLIPQATLP